MTTSTSAIPVLPNHHLIEIIDEDAHTVMYRATRERDGQPVIVKTLKREKPDPKHVARLMHEYQVTKDLDLPGVVRAYGLERHHDTVALLLEDFGGRSLKEELGSRSLDTAAVLHIAIALTAALEGVHRQQIIHKDIKPQNIIINAATGLVKLTDFGVASQLTSESQRMGVPQLLEGTLAYMSPEQTGRMNRAIDYRSDFYSLGVTLYELLTGVLPFQAIDPMELVHSHIARRPVPPHELVPSTPLPLSEIVMKLLSKTAEERYQHAHGLKADLERCLNEWAAAGHIEPFALGRQDLSDSFRIPQKLYGREAEIRQLLEAFAEASAGATRLVLVSGYSGIGKTMLVHEIHKPVTAERGFFISGKFDQLKRSTPHAALIQAFQELIHQLLQSEEQLEHWRDALQQALGTNGQLMLDVIPELEQLIGPQQPIPQLGPTESQIRFHMVLRHFIGVFAQSTHPLVIFMDDLQWADLASLKLIQLLLTDEELGHLLMIGAYRDNEVNAAHPLVLTLDEIEKAGTSAVRIVLAPLSLAHGNQLIADTLSTDEAVTQELAALVQQKTGGNPFFLQQFLKMLYEEKLLAQDVATGRWTWDERRIQDAAVTDNVVSLMTGKIQRLAPATQAVVTLAACSGFQFDLKMLATIHEQPPARTAADLWEAIREGLIVPLDGDYKLLQGNDQAALEALVSTDFNVSYRFLHDRVQQAAYELCSEDEKQHIHLRIGQLMLKDIYAEHHEEYIFTIVNHLNAGAALLTTEAERSLLGLLNLNAGKKAKSAAAFESASQYIKAGMHMLPPDSWTSNYGLTLALRKEAAECAYLTGQVEEAEQLFNEILQHAASKRDQSDIFIMRMQLYTNLGRYAEGVAVGLEGLRLFGLDLPSDEAGWQSVLPQTLAEARATLGDQKIEDLLDGPLMSDPEQQTVVNLLMAMGPLAYNTSPLLLALLASHMVIRSIKYGNTESSPYGYSVYGMILAAMLQDYPSAHAFGLLAIKLNEKFQTVELRGKVAHLFGSFIDHWCNHLSSSLPYLKQAYLDSLELGDLVYATFACWVYCVYSYLKGDELHDVAKETGRYLTFARRTKNDVLSIALALSHQTSLSLQGRTQAPASLQTDDFDEEQYVATLQSANLIGVINQYAIYKLQLHYLFKQYDQAQPQAQLAEQTIMVNSSSALLPEYVFYNALLQCARYPQLPADEGPAALEALQQQLSRLKLWATHAPQNHQARALLVEAELARISGQDLEAWRLYDQAIDAAREHALLPIEALANELAAELYLAQGKEKIARVYLLDSHYAYSKWGASAKAQALVDAQPVLLARSLAVRRETSTHTSTSSTTSQEHVDLLDMMTVMKAAQAISGELELDALLERLLEIVLQNAGAERGILLLNRDGQLREEALVDIDPELTFRRMATPLAEATDCARSVVERVAATLAPVVLHDAAHEPDFADDAYIRASQSKSLLCLPLIHQGHLTGVLYLENNLASDVFTPERTELLGLLSSQAAIAIENALLYQNLQTMSDQLRTTNRALEEQNQTLERRVEERTVELRDANARLQLELLERQRMEEERVRLQEEIIRAQAQTLAELSTPLIPITDSVLVMPLIGAMDSARAQQVLETLLHGVQTNRGRLVIIDITGVPVVDTAVASTLMRAAQALRLLGAQTVITGIRPEVAQTIVQLGLDLTSINTTGSLQNGIAYALRLAGNDGLGLNNDDMGWSKPASRGSERR